MMTVQVPTPTGPKGAGRVGNKPQANPYDLIKLLNKMFAYLGEKCANGHEDSCKDSNSQSLSSRIFDEVFTTTTTIEDSEPPPPKV